MSMYIVDSDGNILQATELQAGALCPRAPMYYLSAVYNSDFTSPIYAAEGACYFTKAEGCLSQGIEFTYLLHYVHPPVTLFFYPDTCNTNFEEE